jgi:hypothetical protein
MNEHDTLPPGGMGPLDPTDIREHPSCDHYRHWDRQDCPPGCDGHYDFETCDECGKEVCFLIGCDNGWRWSDDGVVVLCYNHPTYEEHMS